MRPPEASISGLGVRGVFSHHQQIMAMRHPNDMARRDLVRQKNAIRKKVSLKLFGRVMGYRECGIRLAEQYGEDPQLASKGSGRRLVMRFWEEFMGGSIPQVQMVVRAVKKSFPPRTAWGEKSKEFFSSDAWRKLRYRALQAHGAKCLCCGNTAVSSGKPLHVDHIKPRYKYPKLELELSNLQVLCHDCNLGKGTWDETDWRPDASEALDPNAELDAEYRRRMN